MRKVLVTGFEPFGGERVNPSWEVVKQTGRPGIVGRADCGSSVAVRVRQSH